MLASTTLGMTQIGLMILTLKLANIQVRQMNILSHHDADSLRWHWDEPSATWHRPEQKLLNQVLPPRLDYAAPGRSRQLLPLATCLYTRFIGLDSYQEEGKRCHFN
jgi:hypothetical protein